MYCTIGANAWRAGKNARATAFWWRTTVTTGRGQAGRGGRNTEFLLSFAIATRGTPIAGDTDGIDGTEDAAGAFVTPDNLTRARLQGLDVARFLDAHDSYRVFRNRRLACYRSYTDHMNDFRLLLSEATYPSTILAFVTVTGELVSSWDLRSVCCVPVCAAWRHLDGWLMPFLHVMGAACAVDGGPLCVRSLLGPDGESVQPIAASLDCADTTNCIISSAAPLGRRIAVARAG